MQSAWKIQVNAIKFIGYFSFKPGSVEYGCSQAVYCMEYWICSIVLIQIYFACPQHMIISIAIMLKFLSEVFFVPL